MTRQTMMTHAKSARFAGMLAGALCALLGTAAPALAQHAEVDPSADVHGAGEGEHGAAAVEHGAAVGEGGEHEHGHGNPTDHFNYTDFGYKSKDIAGGTLEPGEEPMSTPFVGMLINFGLLLLLLAWKVRPAAREFAGARHEEIKSALEEAAKLRAEAQAKVDEYTLKVQAAEAEVDKLIKDIRADAESERARIIAAAEAQARALQKDADSRIAAEIERARLALEREVVNAATQVAEKILREKTTAADQTKIVDGFLADLKTKTAAAGERA
jgi:F-type H+-transporting ATPase subunit b